MKVEKIFGNIPEFHNIVLDKILFESKYPVMFTCKNGNDIYLFVCCLVNTNEIQWIGSKTTYENLIELLENKITIRAAFLNVTENKIIIRYNGQDVDYTIQKSCDVPENLLPTAGEYLDAEEDEYAEELAIFKERSSNVEYVITPKINSFWVFNYSCRSVILADDYFNTDLGLGDVTQYKVGEIHNQRVILA